jgi:hypothetical protein
MSLRGCGFVLVVEVTAQWLSFGSMFWAVLTGQVGAVTNCCVTFDAGVTGIVFVL